MPFRYHTEMASLQISSGTFIFCFPEGNFQEHLPFISQSTRLSSIPLYTCLLHKGKTHMCMCVCICVHVNRRAEDSQHYRKFSFPTDPTKETFLALI